MVCKVNLNKAALKRAQDRNKQKKNPVVCLVKKKYVIFLWKAYVILWKFYFCIVLIFDRKGEKENLGPSRVDHCVEYLCSVER